MSTVTNPKKIDEVLTRGMAKIFPSKDALRKKLASGKRLRLYCGYDPSAPSLHIGNAVSLNKLAQFQRLGHEVIFLVGDFTGMIGDPTEKIVARKKMTREEVLKNAKGYKKQASGYLNFSGKNAAKMMHNSKWSDKITFKGLIDIASSFTVQQMIQRDMFKRRMKAGKEAPIYLHEFLYPLAQGYDSVAMNVDLEIGGNDQMFNMLVGRDLQKIINKKEKFVMTLKLLEDEGGKKMGKTEGNAVFLDQSAENMYGAVMSWTDGLIAIGFEMVTDIPMDEVKKIRADLKNPKKNPRDAKMRLAYEIVKIFHGEKAAKKAQEIFVKTFQKRETPDKIKSINISASKIKLTEFLVKAGMVSSMSDARRKIEQGGVSVDGEKILDFRFELNKNDNNKVVKAGKLGFCRIKF